MQAPTPATQAFGPDVTHVVDNQSAPLADVDLYAGHLALREALDAYLPGRPREGLQALGREAGSAAMQRQARLAHQHPPRLRTHDRSGRRVDEVEFHDAYHVLMDAACRHGLHGSPWTAGPGAHVERAAAFMLATQLEPSVLCPVSMSYAVLPALRAHPVLHARWGPGLARAAYDPRPIPAADKHALTMGMGMTEKQGGSDVRANTTRAEPDGVDEWGARFVLTGHKWFFSAPMCDAHLVLAQAPGGLSCFLLPRWRPDGTLNAVRLQRLKDKLGNRANASAEVEFQRAHAWLVGEEGRGVAQILTMGALTRLDCALGTAGLMRQALLLALHHARQRRAFSRTLVEHAAMANVLADLALESEAATALALRLAAAVDASEHGGIGHESAMRRLLTPLAKFWICKRGSGFAQEAMECLGGNGYVEEGGEAEMARIYREMPLNSIWEGAGNIMALDLLRALRSRDAVPALVHELAVLDSAPAAVLRARAAALEAVDATVDEAQARGLARQLALLVQAALLRRHAPEFVFDTFCASRFDRAADVFGLLPAGAPLGALLTRALPAQAA